MDTSSSYSPYPHLNPSLPPTPSPFTPHRAVSSDPLSTALSGQPSFDSPDPLYRSRLPPGTTSNVAMFPGGGYSSRHGHDLNGPHGDCIIQATDEHLSRYQNAPYLLLRQQVERLQRRVLELDVENSVYKKNYEDIVSRLPQLVGMDPDASIVPPPAPPLNPQGRIVLGLGWDFPKPLKPEGSKLRWWTSGQWKEERSQSGGGKPGGHDGSTNIGQRFLENADGSAVAGYVATDVRARMRACIHSLIWSGQATPTEAGLGHEARAYIHVMLARGFEFLRYCDNGMWKTDCLLKKMYCSIIKEFEIEGAAKKKRKRNDDSDEATKRSKTDPPPSLPSSSTPIPISQPAPLLIPSSCIHQPPLSSSLVRTPSPFQQPAALPPPWAEATTYPAPTSQPTGTTLPPLTLQATALPLSMPQAAAPPPLTLQATAPPLSTLQAAAVLPPTLIPGALPPSTPQATALPPATSLGVASPSPTPQAMYQSSGLPPLSSPSSLLSPSSSQPSRFAPSSSQPTAQPRAMSPCTSLPPRASPPIAQPQPMARPAAPLFPVSLATTAPPPMLHGGAPSPPTFQATAPAPTAAHSDAAALPLSPSPASSHPVSSQVAPMPTPSSTSCIQPLPGPQPSHEQPSGGPKPRAIVPVKAPFAHLRPPSTHSAEHAAEPGGSSVPETQSQESRGHETEMAEVPATAASKPLATKRRIPKDHEPAKLAYQDGIASEQNMYLKRLLDQDPDLTMPYGEFKTAFRNLSADIREELRKEKLAVQRARKAAKQS